MRAAFLALAGLIVALLYFLPAVTVGEAQTFEMARNVGLIVLFAWLAVEAVVLSRQAAGAVFDRQIELLDREPRRFVQKHERPARLDEFLQILNALFPDTAHILIWHRAF